MRRVAVGALVVALIALVALRNAGITWAGTGVGAVFNLGHSNAVNQTSILVGSASGPMLNVTNNGSGTALSLNVPPGRAALQVNTNVVIRNLNADLIDGFDSSRFLKGGGQVPHGRLDEPPDGANRVILVVPGWGSIEASCTGASGYRLFWRSAVVGTSVDLWYAYQTGATGHAVQYTTVAPSSGAYVAPIDTFEDRIVTVIASFVRGGTHEMTLTVSAHAAAAGCVFAAQAVAQ